MDNLHRILQRQYKKHFPENDLNIGNFNGFLENVNETYLNFERDKKLSEQSSLLNDIEYHKITKTLKEEIHIKNKFQSKLQELILNLDETYKTENEGNVLDLIQILHLQIEKNIKIQEELLTSKLIAEKANNAKTDFLSMMSHEIRTPLNAIIGLIYIMEKEDSYESFLENLETLKLSTNNLNLLINDILDFNKIEAGKIDLEAIPFNLKTIISEIKTSLEVRAHERGNKIKLMIDDDIIENLIGDPLRLGQILINLVSNAIKFTSNGTITIILDQIDKVKENSIFKLSVKDTGIGIEKDKFDLIFDKFTQADNQTTRKYGGSGLGLVITRKLLNVFDSDIHLESEINVGSTFSFILSLPISMITSDERKRIKDTIDFEENLNGLRILLVEDYPINITIAKKILGRWNVVIDVAENGLIATQKFEIDKYDLILMDIQMPEMDGYTATKIIREIDKNIPILALTASASMGNQDKAIMEGMNDYVTKPFNPRELNIKLKKYSKK